MLTPKEIAYEVTKALDAKKGQNIRLLKIDRSAPWRIIS